MANPSFCHSFLLLILYTSGITGRFGLAKGKDKPPPTEPEKPEEKEKLPKCENVKYKGEMRKLCYLGSMTVSGGNVSLSNSTFKENPNNP